MFLSYFNSSVYRGNPRTHRELSSGYFSEANQKRLTRDSPIDIYRARLPGSKRLVVSDVRIFPWSPILIFYKYLIDVVPEFGREVSEFTSENRHY